MRTKWALTLKFMELEGRNSSGRPYSKEKVIISRLRTLTASEMKLKTKPITLTRMQLLLISVREHPMGLDNAFSGHFLSSSPWVYHSLS